MTAERAVSVQFGFSSALQPLDYDVYDKSHVGWVPSGVRTLSWLLMAVFSDITFVCYGNLHDIPRVSGGLLGILSGRARHH